MSADKVIAFYGVRLHVSVDDQDAIAALESRTDARLLAARKVRLDAWWGQPTGGEDYHILVGRKIAVLGVEDATEKQVSLEELSQVAAQTDELLKGAGFTERGALLFQLEAQD